MKSIDFRHSSAQTDFIVKTVKELRRPVALAPEEGFFLSVNVVEQVLVHGTIQRMDELVSQQNGDGYAIVVGNPKGEILLIYFVGDFVNWKYNYLRIALSKFDMAFRSKGHTSNFPSHLLLEGDTVYSGGVFWKGIPIAVSGFEEAEDEEFGIAIGQAIEEKCNHYSLAWRSRHPSFDFYERL